MLAVDPSGHCRSVLSGDLVLIDLYTLSTWVLFRRYTPKSNTILLNPPFRNILYYIKYLQALQEIQAYVHIE